MRASRGMGAISAAKQPRTVKKRDGDEPVGLYKEGGWIKDAIKRPGQLHKDLGVPQGAKIPAKKLAAAAKKPGKVGQRARFAETLKGFKK